jgi:hypothetical protein
MMLYQDYAMKIYFYQFIFILNKRINYVKASEYVSNAFDIPTIIVASRLIIKKNSSERKTNQTNVLNARISSNN